MEILGVPLLFIPFILFWVYVLNKKNGVLERLDNPSKYKCTECLGRIPAEAKKCKHCGSKQPTLRVSKQSKIVQPQISRDERARKNKELRKLNPNKNFCGDCSKEISDSNEIMYGLCESCFSRY